jgi:hypothetical protein
MRRMAAKKTTKKTATTPEAPRTATRDLTLGLGMFRWGDDKAAVKKHVPKAEWTVYEGMYAFQKVYYAHEFLELLPGLFVDACIDPGSPSDKKQVVRIEVGELLLEGEGGRRVWDALATLCADLGKPGLELPPPPDADVVSWEHEGVELELSAFAKDASLWIARSP